MNDETNQGRFELFVICEFVREERVTRSFEVVD